MDVIKENGLRINPIPQQAGVQTIQQAIYQAHDSPCGQNLLIYEPIGVTDIRYTDLKDLLEESMNSDLSISNWQNLRYAATTFLLDPTFNNKLMYLKKLENWALSLFTSIPLFVIPYYNYHMTVYDSGGFTIWDSTTPFLRPTSSGPGGLSYTKVPLTMSNPFGITEINLYGISFNPGYFAYINKNNQTGSDTLKSAFLVNQASMPETVMAIGTQLTDPANTRTFGFKNYGFSARQQVPNYTQNPNYGDLGYYACYMSQLYTIPTEDWDKVTLIENIFVRLGLEEKALST